MQMKRTTYVLGIPPLTRILHGFETENRKDAQARAREENRLGPFKGRGVKVYRLSDFVQKSR